MPATTYAIALGSNVRGWNGSPAQTIVAALFAVGNVLAVSSTIETAPMGPSRRRYANAAALIASDETPPELLARLKAIERRFGRRDGVRWGARPIDLDIILWSRGRWRSRGLTVPHVAFRDRRFVLAPLVQVAGGWRDPVTQRTIRQLLRAVDRPRARP